MAGFIGLQKNNETRGFHTFDLVERQRSKILCVVANKQQDKTQKTHRKANIKARN